MTAHADIVDTQRTLVLTAHPLQRIGAFALLDRRPVGNQVGGQSDTTVCKTVSASPVTRAVIGSQPGTIREDLQARGGMAGVGEAADVDLVAVSDGFPPGEQRPVRAGRDSLEGEAMVLGEV